MKFLEKSSRLVLRTICIAVFTLLLAGVAFASGISRERAPDTLSDGDVLEAAQPLLAAEKEYYNIESVELLNMESYYAEDGTVESDCTLLFHMCLKAQSMEELPYIAGMLDAVGASTIEDCTGEQVQAACESGVAQGISLSADSSASYDEAAAAIVQEIDGYSDDFGNMIELAFTIRIIHTQDGQVNEVLGLGDGGRTFPLEEYFPEDASVMRQNGRKNTAEVLKQVAENELTVQPRALAPLYYRVRARDYARTYSSEATYNQTCPDGKHYINLSKYNSTYRYYCHVDCANYVSQAMRAGYIPLDYSDSGWSVGSYNWRTVTGMRDYFYTMKHFWSPSNYENCNAGGIIINQHADGDYYHVNMCVQNDTVTRAYAAHNADHCNKSYTQGYWGSDIVLYYQFIRTTTG